MVDEAEGRGNEVEWMSVMGVMIVVEAVGERVRVVGTDGVVLRVEEFVPSREYQRVRVLVGEVVGWTYSDYLEVLL